MLHDVNVDRRMSEVDWASTRASSSIIDRTTASGAHVIRIYPLWFWYDESFTVYTIPICNVARWPAIYEALASGFAQASRVVSRARPVRSAVGTNHRLARARFLCLRAF